MRPKLYLANDGNYREPRWFASWKHARQVVDLKLPDSITRITGQQTAPFGDAALSFRDTMLASETCEELFTPNAANIPLALNGVEIISNGSGSHHEVSRPFCSHKGSPPACSGGLHWQPTRGKAPQQ